MNYEDDRKLASERGITFKVCTKEGQGQPWNTVEEDIQDLHDAMILANHLGDPYEIGIFANNNGGGYLYWTSKSPDLLNSSVIEMEFF